MLRLLGAICISTVLVSAICFAALDSTAGHRHGDAVDPAPPEVKTSFCQTSRFGNREILTFTRGEGPPVLLLHEFPALSLEALRFAGFIADRGFTVQVPVLFGKPPSRGPPSNIGGFFGSCVFGRFSCFSRDSSGSVVAELRELSSQLHHEHPNQRLGIVGLCLTGAIPLSLATDPWVGAVVLGQPALPFGIRNATKASIAASPCDVAQVKTKRVPVLALRFSRDTISPRARLECLCNQIGPQMQVLEIASGKGADDIPASAHAVLTMELRPVTKPPGRTRVALQRTLDFLAENLQAQHASRPQMTGGESCRWTILRQNGEATLTPGNPGDCQQCLRQ